MITWAPVRRRMDTIALPTATGSPKVVAPGDDDVAVSGVVSPKIPIDTPAMGRSRYCRLPGNGRRPGAKVFVASQGKRD